MATRELQGADDLRGWKHTSVGADGDVEGQPGSPGPWHVADDAGRQGDVLIHLPVVDEAMDSRSRSCVPDDAARTEDRQAFGGDRGLHRRHAL
jgi:hypothetical protein